MQKGERERGRGGWEERQAESEAVEGREGTGGEGGTSNPWLKRKPINQRIGQTVEK